ncbi:hypothetical protein [Mesorhizobium sp. 43Arga]
MPDLIHPLSPPLEAEQKPGVFGSSFPGNIKFKSAAGHEVSGGSGRSNMVAKQFAQSAEY